MSDSVDSITQKKDQSCNNPFCIRRITRQQSTGDMRFELQIRTSVGVITIKGFRWIRSLNRIQAPTCAKTHLVVQPANVRAAVRRLFTRLMLEQNKFVVPPIVRRKRSS